MINDSLSGEPDRQIVRFELPCHVRPFPLLLDPRCWDIMKEYPGAELSLSQLVDALEKQLALLMGPRW